MAKFRDETGRVVMRSTKQTQKALARKTAETWEDAATKARRGELTQAACVKILGELMERTTGEHLATTSTKDFFKEYLDRRQVMGRADSTVKRYRPILDAFIAHLGPVRAGGSIGSVTPSEVERFQKAEADAGKGGSTVDFALKVLRAVFADAHRKGLSLTNPARAVDLAEASAEKREPFSDKELAALLRAAAGTDWEGMVFLGVHCGLRINDAANVRWTDLDLKAQTLTIRPQKTSRRRGDDGTLRVFMHPQLVSWLKHRSASAGNTGPLFPALADRPSGTGGGLSNAFLRVMERAGIETGLGEEKKGKGRRFRAKGFHALRHTLITRLAKAEVSPDIRRAMAGHSSDAVHRRYVHLDVSSQAAAVNSLETIGGDE